MISLACSERPVSSNSALVKVARCRASTPSRRRVARAAARSLSVGKGRPRRNSSRSARGWAWRVAKPLDYCQINTTIIHNRNIRAVPNNRVLYTSR
jgi:hypothetical protein